MNNQKQVLRSKTHGHEQLKSINKSRENISQPPTHTLNDAIKCFEQCKTEYEKCRENLRLALVDAGYHPNTIRAILNPNASKSLTEAERIDWKAYNAYRNCERLARNPEYDSAIRNLAKACVDTAEKLKEAQRTLVAFKKNGVPSTVFILTR